MKTIFKTGMAIVAAMTLFTSCGGDDDGGSVNNNTPSGAYVHGKVDGVQFETVTVQGFTSVYAVKSGTGEDMQIIVSGSDASGNILALTTHGINTTGTYELNDLQAVMLYTNAASEVTYDTSDDCADTEGTLTVTHLDDTKIEGTFEFTGKHDEDCSQSKTVTDGSFRGIFVTE